MLEQNIKLHLLSPLISQKLDHYQMWWRFRLPRGKIFGSKHDKKLTRNQHFQSHKKPLLEFMQQTLEATCLYRCTPGTYNQQYKLVVRWPKPQESGTIGQFNGIERQAYLSRLSSMEPTERPQQQHQNSSQIYAYIHSKRGQVYHMQTAQKYFTHNYHALA